MKSIYLKRLFKIFLFCLIALLLDQTIGLLFHSIRDNTVHYPCIDLNKTIYAVNKVHDNIIIVGSSEASIGLDPNLIQTKLKKTCFNLGHTSIAFWWEVMTIKAIFDRYTPEILIWDVGPNPLSIDVTHNYRDIEFMARYKDISPTVDSLINNSIAERIKYTSLSYTYNSTFIEYMRLFFKGKTMKNTKGYIPETESMITKADFSTFTLKDTINLKTKELYAKILSQCIKKGCKVYCVFAPKYLNYTHYPNKSIKSFEQLCDSLGCTSINLAQDTTFLNHPNYFYENYHLNKKGAEIYTHMILDSIGHSFYSIDKN